MKGGTITLASLIEAGTITPGPNVLSVSVGGGQNFTAGDAFWLVWQLHSVVWL